MARYKSVGTCCLGSTEPGDDGHICETFGPVCSRMIADALNLYDIDMKIEPNLLTEPYMDNHPAHVYELLTYVRRIREL